MAEKYVRRGEIYAVRSGEEHDPQGGFTRPGLIISNNIGNRTSSTVIVAMLTTKDHNIGIHYGPFNNTGRPSFLQCETLLTVSKNRLGHLMGQLSENQMKEVESRLDEVLDLGYVDNTPLREKEAECDALRLELAELKARNAELEKRASAHDDEILTRDVEIAVHKRMYEKAVGIIAAMRAEPDMPERPGSYPKPKPPKKTEENPPQRTDDEPKLVDINTAKFSVLRGIGLPNSVVLALINGRPYKKVEDVKNVPGMSGSLYRIIEKKICCVPVVEEKPQPPVEPAVEAVEAVVPLPEKANINTATWQELVEIAGLSKLTAQGITAYRNKHGRYTCLDELLNCPRFGKVCMKRYGDKLEV